MTGAEIGAAPVARPGAVNLHAKEISGLLGYALDYVYELTKKGQIPHVKRRGRVLFPVEWVEAWQAGAELETLQLPGGGRVCRPVEGSAG